VCAFVCVVRWVIVNDRQIKLVFHSTRANDLYCIYRYYNTRITYADVAITTDVWQVFTGTRFILLAKSKMFSFAAFNAYGWGSIIRLAWFGLQWHYYAVLFVSGRKIESNFPSTPHLTGRTQPFRGGKVIRPL